MKNAEAISKPLRKVMETLPWKQTARWDILWKLPCPAQPQKEILTTVLIAVWTVRQLRLHQRSYMTQAIKSMQFALISRA
jgi:hypothetical protein